MKGAQNVRIQIKGEAEARAMLKLLPDKMKKKVVMSIFRKSTVPLIREARANIKAYSPSLASSIGNMRGKGKDPLMMVAPRVKGKYKKLGWFAHFTEYGTSGIVKKSGGYKRASDNPDFAKWVGKVKSGSRYRQQQNPRPYMRPAVDAQKGNVAELTRKLMQEELAKTIRRFTKK